MWFVVVKTTIKYIKARIENCLYTHILTHIYTCQVMWLFRYGQKGLTRQPYRGYYPSMFGFKERSPLVCVNSVSVTHSLCWQCWQQQGDYISIDFPVPCPYTSPHSPSNAKSERLITSFNHVIKRFAVGVWGGNDQKIALRTGNACYYMSLASLFRQCFEIFILYFFAFWIFCFLPTLYLYKCFFCKVPKYFQHNNGLSAPLNLLLLW